MRENRLLPLVIPHVPCLLILDNVETILQGDVTRPPDYRAGLLLRSHGRLLDLCDHRYSSPDVDELARCVSRNLYLYGTCHRFPAHLPGKPLDKYADRRYNIDR